jgi:hypothetical protein
MKIFVSYSFRDSELHIVSLLLEELRHKGYTVETSDQRRSFYTGDYKITNSDFFVGIITNNSESINSVIREWRMAKSRNVKNILVIEEGVGVGEIQNLQFIRFNRNSPQSAINQLLPNNRQVQPGQPAANIENLVAFGAIVVGVAALLSLLSGRK